MSNYLLELSVIHVALMIAYWLFLRKERQYAKMRFYLLGSTLLALTIPLLKLPKLFFNSKEAIDAVPLEAISLEAVNISPAAEAPLWNPDLLIWIYLSVTAFFLLKFLTSVLHLIYLERKSSREKRNDIHIRRLPDTKGSFTFFNWIFLSDQIDPSEHGYDVILKHEKAHASLGHTYDIIFIELFKACLWWLPTAWFINKEIRKIHEYQADAVAIKSCDVDQYSSILISSTLKTNGLSLASSFHEGLILKRLTAMTQQARNISPWKIGALSAVCALLFIAFACSEEVNEDIKEMGSKSNAITFDQLPPTMQAALADVKEELSFLKIDVPDDRQIQNIKELQELDSELIHTMSVDKVNMAIYIALRKDGTNFDRLSEKSKMGGELFTVVEMQPDFEGGIAAFHRYIANEIRYPLQARQAGVEGRVDVQFVVEKDGSLSEVKAVKGIGAGCDEEAVRVLQNAPPFKPGRQNGKPVRVRMVVPITFKLNEGKTNPDNSTQGIVIVEEVQPKYNSFKVDADYADGEWSGTIYDENGKALPGANIVVMGTTNGTVSDSNGAFKLKASESRDLSISFIGYETARLSGRK